MNDELSQANNAVARIPFFHRPMRRLQNMSVHGCQVALFVLSPIIFLSFCELPCAWTHEDPRDSERRLRQGSVAVPADRQGDIRESRGLVSICQNVGFETIASYWCLNSRCERISAIQTMLHDRRMQVEGLSGKLRNECHAFA